MSERRYLIAIGSPESPGLSLGFLDRIPGDVARIADFFTTSEQGYEHILAAEVPLGATTRQIEDSLSSWFSHEDRRESDCVVIYVAGHGDSGEKFGDHCLFTSDSDPRRPNSFIRTAELVRWFFDGEGARPQNVLLILDVCYAGQGAGEAGAELVKAQSRALRGSGAGFWIIATSDPNTEAGDGAFVEALLAVMKDEAWMPRGGAGVLAPHSLSTAVNAWFSERKLAQRSLAYMVAGGRVEPTFIRNPGFTRDLDGVSVADEAHWAPKARGVETSSAPGWFFTGRQEVLRDLCAWLQVPQSDLRARIVTGGPGSGKSAVLGWLVLATREATRQVMQETGLLIDSSLVPPVGSLAARVHTRGMRLNDVTTTLASLLSCAGLNPSTLVAELSSRPGPIGIVVDSLDEAAEAVAIERELLAELASCPSVRLIVGSRRRKGRPPLEGAGVILDLDDPHYFDRVDLVSYVLSRLTFRGAVYESQDLQVHARRIAEIVAERAGCSFLYARLASRKLSQASAPLDTARVGWQEELSLPADLTDAFDTDLERFNRETRRRFVDLLVPLAYARGKGLPQKNVWATVASRIAGREYTNADLRELKEQAGYYLVQDTESGEVVYRLFHQTFADYLKDMTRDEGVERSFAEALLSLLALLPAGVEPWSQAGEPYLVNHFPAHAGAGGLLEEQLKSPGFLLHVSPDALLPELHRASSPEARRSARAYRRASHWMRSGDDDASLTYLLWGAYQHGAHEIAQRLLPLCPRLPWHPEWAAWQTVISGHVLGRIETPITAITTGHDDQGSPVGICGYAGGSIRVWNIATSEKLLEIRPTRPFKKRFWFDVPSVKHLAFKVCAGRSLIIGAWDEGSLGVFDLQDGNELGWIKDENSPTKINALCVVPVLAESFLMTATDDFALHTWQLPDLRLIARRENAAAAAIYDLAPIEYQGEAAVVAGADSVVSGELTEKHPIRIWSIRDLRLLWHASKEDVSNAMEVRACIIGEKSWIIVRDFVGDVTLLNPMTGDTLNVIRGDLSDRFFSRIIGLQRQDSGVILIGERFSRLRVLLLYLSKGSGGQILSVEELPVRTEVRGNFWSDVIELNCRPTLVSADGHQLRVWDVQELLDADVTQEQGRDAGPLDMGENSLVAVAANDSVIAAGSLGSGYSDLELWDARGRLLWSRRFEHERLQDLAVADVDGSQILVWVTRAGTLHTVSSSDGTTLQDPVKLGDQIFALSVRMVKGRSIAFIATNLNTLGESHYVVRAWDLQAWREVKTTAQAPFPSPAGEQEWKLEGLGYYRTKTLWCVDALNCDGSTIVVFAGPHGEVRAMDLESLEEIDRWEGGAQGAYVHSLAIATCNGRPLVFAGDQDGRFFARDLATRQDVCPRLDAAHHGSIEALRVQQTELGACIVSGGADGVVNLWRPDLTLLAKIETERPVNGLAFAGSDRLAVANDRGLTLLHIDWELIFHRP